MSLYRQAINGKNHQHLASYLNCVCSQNDLDSKSSIYSHFCSFQDTQNFEHRTSIFNLDTIKHKRILRTRKIQPIKTCVLKTYAFSGLRLHRVSGRGGRRLLDQDHEHDQTVRQTDQVSTEQWIHKKRIHFLSSQFDSLSMTVDCIM